MHLRRIAGCGEDILIDADGAIVTTATVEEGFGPDHPVRTFGGTESPWISGQFHPCRRGLRKSRNLESIDIDDLGIELTWEDLSRKGRDDGSSSIHGIR